MNKDLDNFSWLEWAREYKKVKYKGTLQVTHTLFFNNLDLREIVKKRNLKEETIERQFIALIVKGLVHVADIIDEKKMKKIQDLSKKYNKLSQLKEKLGKKYSYFEIKVAIAAIGVDAKRRNQTKEKKNK